jgi:hypothetical protein
MAEAQTLDDEWLDGDGRDVVKRLTGAIIAHPTDFHLHDLLNSAAGEIRALRLHNQHYRKRINDLVAELDEARGEE